MSPRSGGVESGGPERSGKTPVTMEAVASSGGMMSSYADSLDSSPRSRGGESWDEPAPAPAAKHRLMCSYGGRIVPRPTDKSLCYLGGETRMVVVDRHATLADLSARLSSTLLSGRPFTLKYQLPNEDLDSLISLTTDEDLDNMFEEYDRIASSSRLRLFLFPASSASPSASEDSSAKSDSWFVDALNGSAPPAPRLDVNSLLGLQDADSAARPQVLDTNSSFGSACSAPSVSNLPPIRVRPAERLEHQFANAKLSTTDAPPAAAVPPTENPDQIFSAGEEKLEVPPPVKPFVAEDPPVVDSTARPVYYQDTSPPAPTVPTMDRKHDMPIADSSYHGYLMPQMQQEQLQQQQQQQQQQQRYYQQPPQQFIHPNAHYIHSASGLPMPPYYPPIQQSQQYDSQTPMYFMPVRPSTPYNLATGQPNVGDAVLPVVKPAVAPLPSKAELATNLYRTSVATAPIQSMPQAPLLHLAADQAHPYASMGYHMMHQHPSQTGATMVSHGYEYSDPSQQPRAYYTQNTPPAMYASQYQTMASAPVIPDVVAASQMQPSDVKQTRAQ